MEGQFNVRA